MSAGTGRRVAGTGDKCVEQELEDRKEGKL